MAQQAYFLDINAYQAQLSVCDVCITEQLNKPYELKITVTTASDLNLLQGLDKPALFTVCPVDEQLRAHGGSLADAVGKPERLFHGVVTSCKRIGSTLDENIYEICIGPQLARLANFIDTRLLQNVNVPDAIAKILRTDLNLTGHQFQFKTTREYPVLETLTQWRESSLDFITRLCESVGLFFYFSQETDKHQQTETLVFTDDLTGYIKATDVQLFRPESGLSANWSEAVLDLEIAAKPVIGQYGRADYNYRTSGGASLLGNKQAWASELGFVGRDYQPGFHQKTTEEGIAAATLAFEIARAQQVVASGKSTVLAFTPGKIFRTDRIADPLAEFGWVLTKVVHTASRRSAWANTFEAIPADRIFRSPIGTTPIPKITGTIPARITSPSRYRHAYVDESGRYRVSFMYDKDAVAGNWPPAGSSRLMRLARPYAGDEYGFHMPLTDGTEIQVGFVEGSLERPYIAHAMHDQTKPDLLTNKNNSRAILRTLSGNKLRFEDKDERLSAKLSTPHQKSQLNLGFLVDSKKDPRGQGAELRTDGWLALRSAKGTWITADAQPGANGQQLDMQAALDELQQAQKLTQSLRDAATQAKAELADLQTQTAFLQTHLTELKQAAILLSAPAGIASVTPDTIQTSAGKNLIFTAGGQTDFGILKSLTIAAGDAISFLANKLGIKLYAAKGNVDLQAQTGVMSLASRQAMTLTSTEGEVTIAAKQKLTLMCGGAYIKLEGGAVEIGGPGDLKFKTASFGYSGPSSLDKELPFLPQSQLKVSRSAGYSE